MEIKMLILLLLLSGCASDQTTENSALPWNRPAAWEHRRDISTSIGFHKKYTAEDMGLRPMPCKESQTP
ncbi:MAG: hypothetical protein LBF34_04485 [Puniceicoccales bacterium]|jgi:hypothetical protein|nr:hypothetical protein [Puniceicoccales bacterium]